MQENNENHLNKGALNAWQVAGLGVSIVIAGQFTGWNYGLAFGGWGGMFIATLVVAVLYLALTQCLAELSSTFPTAGGFYTYAERAFGDFPGYLAGISVLIALGIGNGLIPVFIAGYTESVLGIGGWPVMAVMYLVILSVHLYGVGEAMGFTLFIGALAVAVLLVFCAMMVPHFEVANLFNLADTDAGNFLPFGWQGVFACIPFGVWLFISVEHSALAAEEVGNPAKTMPRALIGAIVVLLVTGLGVLIFAAGGGGAEQIKNAADPLYEAIQSELAYGKGTWTTKIIGFGALFGLIATFFSIMYASSRQLFSLARAGYLPRILAKTGKRETPYVALLTLAFIGIFLTELNPDKALVLVVFLLNIAYLFVLSAFIYLRVREKDTHRPYRAYGGIWTACLALILTTLVIAATTVTASDVILNVLIVYAILVAYYFIFGRRHAAEIKIGA